MAEDAMFQGVSVDTRGFQNGIMFGVWDGLRGFLIDRGCVLIRMHIESPKKIGGWLGRAWDNCALFGEITGKGLVGNFGV
jgi:hypothetical protein